MVAAVRGIVTRGLRAQRDTTLGLFDDAYVDLPQVASGSNFGCS